MTQDIIILDKDIYITKQTVFFSYGNGPFFYSSVTLLLLRFLRISLFQTGLASREFNLLQF